MATPRELLAQTISALRHDAISVVREHARLHCRHVAPRDVRAIENALGDISVDEAIAALDRIERERR